jgi:hypothetical protein
MGSYTVIVEDCTFFATPLTPALCSYPLLFPASRRRPSFQPLARFEQMRKMLEFSNRSGPHHSLQPGLQFFHHFLVSRVHFRISQGPGITPICE